MSLRTLLLIIGALIVVAVYGLTAYKRRRDSRLHFDRRFTRLDAPEALQRYDADDNDRHQPRISPRGEGFDEIIAIRTLSPDEVPPLKPAPRKGLLGAARAAAAALSSATPPPVTVPVAPVLSAVQIDDHVAPPTIRLPGEVVLPPQDEALAALPAVRNDNVPPPEASNARKRTDQLELFGGSLAPSPPAQSAGRRRTHKEPAAEPISGLISLYVRAHEGQQFSGTTLVKALNAVAMQFGEMAIFHHFGAGELKCQTPVFSAANMFEPGTFDLRKIEAFRTAGVALFLQLPGPLDGPVAFELLLNTAQRLTELTGGELYVDPKHMLDPASIARLRKRAAYFTHARH